MRMVRAPGRGGVAEILNRREVASGGRLAEIGDQLIEGLGGVRGHGQEVRGSWLVLVGGRSPGRVLQNDVRVRSGDSKRTDAGDDRAA